MTPDETARVLAKCAAFDQRTVGRSDVLAWAEVLDDVPLGDALAAVTGWYREHRERAMPSDIRHLAQDIDRDRRRVEREAREAQALAQLESEPARSVEVGELLARLRDSLPSVDERKIRRPEVLEWDRARERATWAQPNPHYDPALAKRLDDGGAPCPG